MNMICPVCERLRVLSKVSSPERREEFARLLAEHQREAHGVEPAGLAAGLWKGKEVVVR